MFKGHFLEKFQNSILKFKNQRKIKMEQQGVEQTTTAFPFDGMMPKTATGAWDFMKKHPKNDGTGVVVAVFDSGVDLGAVGLQVSVFFGIEIC